MGFLSSGRVAFLVLRWVIFLYALDERTSLDEGYAVLRLDRRSEIGA